MISSVKKSEVVTDYEFVGQFMAGAKLIYNPMDEKLYILCVNGERFDAMEFAKEKHKQSLAYRLRRIMYTGYPGK